MGQLHELRIRSNRFIEQLDSTIESIIDDNQELLDLNRSQLKDDHSTALDEPIKPPYSKGYAALKGFKTPDLYVSGALYKAMRIESKLPSYLIDSSVDYWDKLVGWYGKNLGGIGPKRQPKAKQITTLALSKLYKSQVLKRS